WAGIAHNSRPITTTHHFAIILGPPRSLDRILTRLGNRCGNCHSRRAADGIFLPPLHSVEGSTFPGRPSAAVALTHTHMRGGRHFATGLPGDDLGVGEAKQRVWIAAPRPPGRSDVLELGP